MTCREGATNGEGIMGSVRSLLILAAFAGFMATGIHSAKADGDAKRGEQIAAKWCAKCHVIDPGAKRAGENQPASFQEIADTPGFGAFALNVFFQTPHKEMPNFTITGELRDDLIAYITSLKRK